MARIIAAEGAAADTSGRVVDALQEVMVRDIRLAADIGVHAHEIGRRQALVVHARLKVRPVASDQLADTIDYNAIVGCAEALAQERINLIETFARRLASACLRHAGVEEADIVVEKPGALLNGLASAHVVMKAA